MSKVIISGKKINDILDKNELLPQTVIGSLERLAKNPQDLKALSKLSKKHQDQFEYECGYLSNAVVGSLERLAKNPQDLKALSKLVQSADTIMGDAKFINKEKLGEHATKIVRSFSNVKDVRKRIDEFYTVRDEFSKIVAKNRTCPAGYFLKNDSCVIEK